MDDERPKVLHGPLTTAGVVGLVAGVVRRSRRLVVLGIGALALDRLPAVRRLNERLGDRIERKTQDAGTAAQEQAEQRTE